MTDNAQGGDEALLLRDIRALLDQLQLDHDDALSMDSKLTDDLGVDSLALVELCDQLERTFDVSLPDEVFLTASTPHQWLAAIAGARRGTSSQPDDVTTSVGAPKTSPPSVAARTAARSKQFFAMVRDVRHRRARRSTASISTDSLIYALYAWTLLVPFAASIWLLAAVPLNLRTRRIVGRAVSRATCRALGISVTVQGNLPGTDHPAVITANHSSFIDGLLLYVFLDEPLTFVSSTDMEHQFLVGRIMRGFGCVFVERGRAERSAASIEVLRRTIRCGHVLIFPEGSISARPGLRVFHLGAFETAASANCLVIPVGIRGSREILRPGSFRPRPGAVHIAIGKPVQPTGSEFVDRVAIRDQVRDAIAGLCGDDAT